MALIGNLTGLWLVVLLIIQSGNVGETLFKILDIPFPPASPVTENLDDICCQAHGRPRYPDSFFPRSGHSHLRRRGKAINRLESWYAFCCSDDVAWSGDFLVLCCAQQAWKQALSEFCVDEYSIKTSAYMCCESSGLKRWACFNSQPNPSYSAKPGYTAPSMPHEPGLNFNKKECWHFGKRKYSSM